MRPDKRGRGGKGKRRGEGGENEEEEENLSKNIYCTRGKLWQLKEL